jgi:SAM-dependent methyltransferase
MNAHAHVVPDPSPTGLACTHGWILHRELVWQSTRTVGERLVELLDPRPGESVLELGAGAGDTGFLAAGRLQPRGRLLSTDVDPAAVAALRRNADDLGLENVDVALADAHATGLGDGAFDGILWRFGPMLCAEPVRALAECRRLLRLHGRLALAVWADRRRNPWGSAVTRALDDLGLLEALDPRAPGAFALDDPRLLRAHVVGAGLTVESEECVLVSWRYASFDAFWDTACRVSRILAGALVRLAPSQKAAVRARLAELFEPFASADGLVLPGAAHLLLARRR